MRPEKIPRCMRVMLVANIDVEHGFANGSTGRLVRWSPEVSPTERRVKRVRANVPEVQARFYHEASYQSKKRYFSPQVDVLDIVPCKEVVATAKKGEPSMLQFTVRPAYCLTIHKVQGAVSPTPTCFAELAFLLQIFWTTWREHGPPQGWMYTRASQQL